MIKVLNLYAGIGGNRKLWPNDKIEVTAVEIEPKIAKIYQDFFPNDKVIVADAHQFLLEHFKEFDFIWSSPPCPTHSRIRKMGVAIGRNSVVYPDMRLYQEIILLKTHFKGKFCVENVISYYEPLIEPFKINNHYTWTNFKVESKEFHSRNIHARTTHSQKEEDRIRKEILGFDISNNKEIQSKDKITIIRNCVNPELGLHIFNMAFLDKQKSIGDML